MLKLCCISDLHGYLPEIEPCDLLIIAGDICPATNHKALFQAAWLNSEFRWWLNRIPATEIVGIFGNHDFIGEKAPHLIPQDLRWHYLEDSSINLFGLKIWGTPHQPPFLDWAYNLPEEELKKKWDLIPADTDILVVHGPPHGIGDFAPPNYYHPNGQNCGSPSLTARIMEIEPSLVVNGHIHSGHGIRRLATPIDHSSIIANVSLLDESYKPIYPITYFEVNTYDDFPKSWDVRRDRLYLNCLSETVIDD